MEDRRLLAVWTVNTPGDVTDAGDSLLTLREAIVAANGNGGADTIEFDPSLTAGGPASIVLTQGELAITDALSINGLGANLLTVDASGNDLTAAAGDGSRVFNIGDGNNAAFFDSSISGVTITGADAKTHFGGGIFSRENLTLQNCVVSGNSVTPDTSVGPSSDGGGVSERYASLTITGCVITGNHASSQGGGVSFDIYPNWPSVLTIADSSFANNTGRLGGGLYWSGIGSITDSTFSDNSAGTGIGGAILCELHSGSFNVGQKLITRTTIEGNSATNGGGVYLNFEGSQTSNGILPSLKLVDCDLNHNTATSSGGGLGTNSTTGATGKIKVEVDGTSFTYNTASTGGGAYLSQVFGDIEGVVDGCTFAHNNGGTTGGGLYSSLPELTLSDSDFTGNTVTAEGGGAYILNGPGSTSFSVDDSSFTQNSAPTAAGLSLHLSSGTSRTVSNLTVNNNVGDGIFFTGGITLNVNNSIVTGNQKAGITGSTAALNVSDSTVSNNGAGGIRSSNSAVGVTNCIVSGNTGSVNGGGVLAGPSSALTVISSTISGNSTTGVGGGIKSGSATLTDCVVTDNVATASGGGISTGTLSLTRSLLARNTSTTNNGGGAICSSATISQSVISDNKTLGTAGTGGGMRVAGAVTLTDSSVTNNSVLGSGSGGGISADGNLTLQQSTVSGNRTNGTFSNGGGISGSASLFAYNSTITNNVAAQSKGGGFYAGAATIKNTIIAGNTAGVSNPDLRFTGSPTINYSIVGDKAGTTLVESQTPNASGSRIGYSLGGGIINPQLGPLTYNSGPTFLDGSGMLTQVPLPASPALNAGDPNFNVVATPRDQRGGGWVRKVGARIDIGAIEAQPNLLPGDYNFNGVVDAADTVLWRKLSGSSTDLRADGDGNGTVNSDDYDFWRTRFGNTIGTGTTLATTVVESSSSQPNNESNIFEPVAPRGPISNVVPSALDSRSTVRQSTALHSLILPRTRTSSQTTKTTAANELLAVRPQTHSRVHFVADVYTQRSDTHAADHGEAEHPNFDDIDLAFDLLASKVI